MKRHLCIAGILYLCLKEEGTGNLWMHMDGLLHTKRAPSHLLRFLFFVLMLLSSNTVELLILVAYFGKIGEMQTANCKLPDDRQGYE